MAHLSGSVITFSRPSAFAAAPRASMPPPDAAEVTLEKSLPDGLAAEPPPDPQAASASADTAATAATMIFLYMPATFRPIVAMARTR